MPVLFEPDEMPQWPTGLQIYETLKTVKKGSVSRIAIEVHNTSQHDIVLLNRTPLGRLQLVKSVTPMEVRLARDKGLEPQCKDDSCTTTGVRDEGLCQESDNAVPEVDMTGLTREQEEEVRPMLKEEAASFAKNEDDIGCMEDLQMDIELSDSTPIRSAELCVNPKTPLSRSETLH